MDSNYINILNEDLNRLKLLLTPLVEENITVKNHSLRCLNLACGRADESGILREILAPLTENLQIIGVDIRERELDIARSRWRSDPHTNYSFLYHDATKLHLIAELAQPCDIILMRHQNYWNGAATWQSIYDSALQRLSPEGILVITSYFDKEHLQALQAIQQLGATLIITIQNPQSRPVMDAPYKSVDRHIAIFSKQQNHLLF
jgi:2-polyprenyl-3-methyl-5-hydroxy-6-metoxy-1,4-benzoquinol methylase